MIAAHIHETHHIFTRCHICLYRHPIQHFTRLWLHRQRSLQESGLLVHDPNPHLPRRPLRLSILPFRLLPDLRGHSAQGQPHRPRLVGLGGHPRRPLDRSLHHRQRDPLLLGPTRSHELALRLLLRVHLLGHSVLPHEAGRFWTWFLEEEGYQGICGGRSECGSYQYRPVYVDRGHVCDCGEYQGELRSGKLQKISIAEILSDCATRVPSQGSLPVRAMAYKHLDLLQVY